MWFRKEKKTLDDEQKKDVTAETTAADEVMQEAVAAEPETAEASAAEETPTASEPSAEPEKSVEPDWKDRYTRTMADFDNFRKRVARDREDLVKSAAADILKDILPTVDNLALALDKAKDAAEDPFVKGVQLVYDGLVKMLADHGATPLDSLGEPLDPNFHEALATLPSADVEEGLVMNEVKRGWLLHGKLLRAAQVVVSAGKQA